MNSFEILITLLFIVIIYAAIFKKMTSEMIIGGSALWFVILWIGFDNMGMWSNSPLTHIFEKCGFKSTNQKRKRLNQNKSSYIDYKKEMMADENLKNKLNATMQEVKSETKSEPKINAESETTPIKSTVIFKPIEYSEENYKYNLFDEIGCLGDNMLAHKMKHISNKNREAMDNFSRTYSKYSNINYFEQELKDAAASRWWDNEDLENDF